MKRRKKRRMKRKKIPPQRRTMIALLQPLSSRLKTCFVFSAREIRRRDVVTLPGAVGAAAQWGGGVSGMESEFIIY